MSINPTLLLKADEAPHPIGHSAGRLKIEMTRIGDGPKPILIVGGVHGDESEGIDLITRFLQYARKSYRNTLASLYIIPVFNPDGARADNRLNANGVDLNRNLPTQDWSPVAATPRYQPGPAPASEPETQLMIDLIDTLQPLFILSAHSYKYPMINTNGDCTEIAKAMRDVNGLLIKPDIGYPTPGSLGTYAGKERKIPTITLEVLDGDLPDPVWANNRQALIQAIETVTSQGAKP